MPDDCVVLSKVRMDYIRNLYRGFADESLLKGLSLEAMQDKILTHMQRPYWQVVILEKDGQPQGYISFGKEQNSEDGAVIDDAAILPGCEANVRYDLISHAISVLEEKNYRHIHLWVLRDNFRVRFLYESFGFRREGVTREASYAGHDVEEMRYLYVPGRINPYHMEQNHE